MRRKTILTFDDLKKVKGGYLTRHKLLIQTNIFGPSVDHAYFKLSTNGMMYIEKDYFFDGATCAMDTETFMAASLVHDVLYQALRELLFFNSTIKWTKKRHNEIRVKADACLIFICNEDGMCKFRQWYVKRGLRLANGIYARPDIEHIIGVYQEIQEKIIKLGVRIKS
jgi:hypothetical protein